MKVLNSLESLKKVNNKLLSDVAKKNNLTLIELKILLFLDKSECSLSKDIVMGIQATKSHVSMAVCSLEQKGFIVKCPDELSKKSNHLCLTDRAKPIVKKGDEVQTKLKEIMLDGINEEELNILTNIAKRMQDNLDKYNKM